MLQCVFPLFLQVFLKDGHPTLVPVFLLFDALIYLLGLDLPVERLSLLLLNPCDDVLSGKGSTLKSLELRQV